jgi:DNA adenine methylase
MTATLTPPLKWHGGKQYLARRIVGLMPGHTHYVEPYAGGLAVLLAKNPDGVSEVVNDLDGQLMNFWRALQEPDAFGTFARRIQATPFSEQEWKDAQVLLQSSDSISRAIGFFVRCRQSMAGRIETFAPLSRSRTRRGRNEQCSAWTNTVDGLSAVHARLQRVAILNRPALDAIRSQDGRDTLFYCDPPYLHSTRTASTVYDEFEIEGDHCELLEVLLACKGKLMLSGYPSALYNKMLAGWNRHEFNLPNNAAGGTAKRHMTECVWTNF